MPIFRCPHQLKTRWRGLRRGLRRFGSRIMAGYKWITPGRCADYGRVISGLRRVGARITAGL